MPAPIDRRLLAESRAMRSQLLAACALGVLSAALVVAQASLLAELIARAATGHPFLRELRVPLIALACVLAARALVTAAFELSGRWGAAAVMAELRGRLTRRMLLELPGRRPARARTGELANASVQGVDALEGYLAGYLPQFVLASLVPLAVIAWTAALDPVTAGILVLSVPILVVFMVLVGRRARAQADARWRALTLLGAHFLDVVRGLATLRAYGREHAQEEILAGVGERYRRETMATLRTAFLSALVLELCAMIGTALVAATIGVQLVAGALSLQAGLTVLLLAPELYGPLRLVGQQFHSSTDAGAAYEQIFSMLGQGDPAGSGERGRDGEPALGAGGRRRALRSPAPHAITAHGLRFRYPGREVDVLRDLELELEPARTTALLGASGAGKSTLALLLMRFLEPDAGELACGGLRLSELDLDGWRSQIAWVPQRPTIFSGTVAENIALYRPRAGARAIGRAADRVGASEFIAALPGGMQTRLGEGGRRLSAGQAQRVALARAALADRPLLILDEPTAHLDRARAGAVGEALAELCRGRTSLLITHDSHLATLADERMQLREGRVLAVAQDAEALVA